LRYRRARDGNQEYQEELFLESKRQRTFSHIYSLLEPDSGLLTPRWIASFLLLFFKKE
jgi:hypothetical protein